MVSQEIIEGFLGGNNPLQYVVGIEGGYSEPFVYLVINDPQRGKYLYKQKYRPFLWFKEEVKHLLYGGDREKMRVAAERKNIRTKKLKTSNAEGITPQRLQNGFKYLVSTSGSYNDLILFFKNAGVDIFDAKYKHLFFMFTPVEQYMIQSKVRLFKGMDDYNDVHRLQFDLETEGLNAQRHSIFAFGIKDNRGYERVLKTTGNTEQEKRNSERRNIEEFFNIIDELKPDIISGFNSESFDWTFIVDRCERLGVRLGEIAIGLDGKTPFRRKPSILKLGGEIEAFNQTLMFGHNIIDIAHSVRRAQAINSNIKSWALKYITKYSDIAKKNRIYVKGDSIYTIWADITNQYALNNADGDWYKVSEKMPLRPNYQIVTGSYIIERYLLDDLWETQEVDTIFNQAAFLIAKILPTTYCRSTTMGTATQWKLIMAAWSYENDLAIPLTESKRDFTGGLSRLLAVGYAKNVVKDDYAALYPKTQLTHDIFPDLDISGVMKGLLTYIVDERDRAKFLMEEHKNTIKTNKNLTPEEIKKLKAIINLMDKKQMPLKILANSWFGANGAPFIFNWGDINCAEETTCRGRQYLRLMLKHHTEKYGFKALILDTDGVNFKFPDNIDDIKYTAKGTHWKTTKNAGKELMGLEAVLAEFNELYMVGRMGLDIDEIYNSTINFSRKNYANDVGGKIKFVGNSIKSKKMPVYIEDFLDVAIRLLLDGKGQEFINYYYSYVDKIYNYNIPLVKIASKSKVKCSIKEYKLKGNKVNKAGNPMPKQAHMELAIQHDLEINLGDTIFYVNTGTGKGDGDVKTIKHDDGKKEIQINCKLIEPIRVDNDLETIREIETLRKVIAAEQDQNEIELLKTKISELELTLITDEYNVAKYLAALNKKVEPLLVCFHPDIRKRITLNIKKDRKTKIEKLDERNIFMESDCVLVSGMPDELTDQDSYEDVMTLEDKEIKFWYNVNKLPNNMEQSEWDTILEDYHVRMKLQRENGIAFELIKIDELFRKFEVVDLDNIITSKIIPDNILLLAKVDEEGNFISKKWDVVLAHIDDMFKYENEAIQRKNWYQISNNETAKDKYELWIKYKAENNIVIEEITELKIDVNEVKVVVPIVEVVEKEEDDEDDEEDDISDLDVMAEIQKEIDSLKNFELPEISEAIQPPLNATKNTVNFLKEVLKDAEEKDEWNF